MVTLRTFSLAWLLLALQCQPSMVEAIRGSTRQFLQRGQVGESAGLVRQRRAQKEDSIVPTTTISPTTALEEESANEAMEEISGAVESPSDANGADSTSATPVDEENIPDYPVVQTGADSAPSLVGEPVMMTTFPPTPAPTIRTSGSEPVIIPPPYPIRMPPFQMALGVTGELDEEGFMETVAAYMEEYMSTEPDFAGFSQINYGISTFSQILEPPPERAPVDPMDNNDPAAETTAQDGNNPMKTITVRVTQLMAVFDGQPDVTDAAVVDYMKKLLENQELFQAYITNEAGLEDTVLHNVILEYDVVEPTRIEGERAENTNVASDEEKGQNTTLIVGITVGAFLLLLWVIFLYHLQSRSKTTLTDDTEHEYTYDQQHEKEPESGQE